MMTLFWIALAVTFFMAYVVFISELHRRAEDINFMQDTFGITMGMKARWHEVISVAQDALIAFPLILVFPVIWFFGWALTPSEKYMRQIYELQKAKK